MHRRAGARPGGWWMAASALIGAASVASSNSHAQSTSVAATEHATSSPALEAQMAPVAPSSLLDAAEADIRTRWIQDRLDAETPAAQRWYWSFLTLSVGATAGQFVLGALSDSHSSDPALANYERDQRIGWYVGGVNAAIGTLPMIIFPFRPAFAASELRRGAARTPQERVARMHHAEALLRECAEGEEFGSGWMLHTAGVVLGVVSSVVLLGFYDADGALHDTTQPLDSTRHPVLFTRQEQAWFNVAVNLVATVAFNEFQVLTQPTRLIQDWSTYKRDRWRTMATRARRNDRVRITPVPYVGGAGVVVQF